MEIVNTALESDRMGRATRAVAQATALDPNADACAAIRRELRLADDFDCTAWAITVHRGVLPSNLSAALGSGSPGATGDMVLVRIDWSQPAWSLANLVPAANAADDSGEDPPDESAGPRLVSRVAIGLARSESPGLNRPCFAPRFLALPPFVRGQRGVRVDRARARGRRALRRRRPSASTSTPGSVQSTAASRMAVAMADYVSRDAAPDGHRAGSARFIPP